MNLTKSKFDDIGLLRVLTTHIRVKQRNRDLWLGEFLATGMGTFPYMPTKRPTIDRQDVRHVTRLNVDPTTERSASDIKVLYLALVAFGEVKDINHSSYRGLLALFQEEAFGVNEDVSRRETRARLGVVLGINYWRSLDADDNDSFWRYVESLPSLAISALRVTAFLWKYQWKKTKTHVYSSPYTAFRILKALNPEAAAGVLNQVRSQGVKMAHSVPFQTIREEIKNSPGAQELVELFRQTHPGVPLYMTTMDSDVVAMRTHKHGLFTYFDHIVANTYEHLGFYPDVMSTGYRAPEDETSDVMALGVFFDMVRRHAMGSVIGNASYYPETCLPVLLGAHSLSDFSYVKKGETQVGMEAKRLLQNAIDKGLIEPEKMFFVHLGSLATRVKQNWRRQSHDGFSSIDEHNIWSKECHKALRGIYLSSLHPRTFASNLYAALPPVKADNGKIRAVLSNLAELFDPFNLAFRMADFSGRRYKVNHFQTAVEALPFLNRLLIDPEDCSVWVESLDGFTEYHDLFYLMVDEVAGLRERLEGFGYNPDLVEKCVLVSKVCGDVLVTYLEGILNGKSLKDIFQMNLIGNTASIGRRIDNYILLDFQFREYHEI